ncbi:hypothetical protein Peur_043938 [Populus x canadensis]
MEFIQAIERITIKPRRKVSFRMASITVSLVGMQEELPFLMALCVAHWKMKIMSRGDKSNCLPSDKLLLWQCLKKKRDVVALIVANNLHEHGDKQQTLAFRCASENIQKFIQPELAMIVSRLSTATIFSISLGQALTTPIQLSWIEYYHAYAIMFHQ